MKQESLKNVKLEQELNDEELDQAAGGIQKPGQEQFEQTLKP